MGRTLELDVAYDASLLAPPSQEMAPTLAVWSSFNGTKSLNFYPLRHVDDGRGKTDVLRVSVELPESGKERRDDAVWFEAYALTPNKDNVRVRNRVGCAFLYVKELKAATGEIAVDLAYFNYWDKNGARRVKGRLLMRVADMPVDYIAQDDDDLGVTPFDFVPAQNAFLQNEMAEQIRRSIWPYTEDAHAAGEGILPLDKKNERVHAPAWNAPAGWKPGYTYFMTPGNRAPPAGDKEAERHLDGVFKTVLKRHDMIEEEFTAVIEDQLAKADDTYNDRFTECCDIVGEALCAPATSCPYIGDAINTHARMHGGAHGMLALAAANGKHGVESFDWVQLRSGGDCEDLARMIHSYRCAVQDGEWSAPVLVAAQKLLHCYIGVGILASVLGAQLSDGSDKHEPFVLDTKRDNNVSIGAHMYYQLIPEHKMLSMIRRVNRNLDIDELRNPLAPTAPWREKMPHLVLEGTGRLQTLQRPLVSYVTDPDPAAKRVVLQREYALQRAMRFLATTATARFRGQVLPITACASTIKRQRQLTRIPNARVNSFYRDSTHAFTDDFIKRGFAVAEFTWVSLGDPDMVPADADDLYRDDPMLANEPSRVPETPRIEAGATDWEQFGATFNLDSDSESTVDVPASTAAPAAPKIPFVDSHFRFPHTAAAPSLTDAQPAASERFDRFDYESNDVEEIRYGIPLTTSLEDRPMRNHVGLLAGAPLDEVAAGVLATHYRHSKPIPRAGVLADARRMHVAQVESLRANGIDVDRMQELEEENMSAFEGEIDNLAQSEWPLDHADLALMNLFVASEHFRVPEVKKFMLDALSPHIGPESAIRHARTWRESFLPGRTSLVVQLLMDPEKFD